MSGAIKFEHDADSSSQVALVKCSLRFPTSLSRMAERHLRIARVIWAVVFGVISIPVIYVMTGSRSTALTMGVVDAVLFYVIGLIPYFANSYKRSYERKMLKQVHRMAKDLPVCNGRWRYTITAEAVEFENLTNGSVVVTKMRSIDRAELTDGHLCLFVQGEVVASVPLEGMESQAQVESFRLMLSEAGAEGWPKDTTDSSL